MSRPFECVLLDDPSLARRADEKAFAEHFDQQAEVVVFPNLGADAVLVVPCPLSDPSVYVHIAEFVRRAPAEQVQAFWQAVGEATAARLGEAPVWLNTAGAGVAWLHVRLDDRPKYYRHRPYKSPPGG